MEIFRFFFRRPPWPATNHYKLIDKLRLSGRGCLPCGFKLDPIWQFGGQGGGSAKIQKFFFHASEAPWGRSAKIRKSENFRNFPKKRATSKENAELESRKFEKFENPKEDAELESRKSEKSENSKENAELESENPKI